MRHVKRCSCVTVVGLFVLHAVFSSHALAQQAVDVMVLADGAKVAMTQAQFGALMTQPGITHYGLMGGLPKLTATQMAIPVPTNLGGGFLVGEPTAIAVGMNTIGVTSTATGGNVAGGTAAAGGITASAAAAGVAAAGGIGAETITDTIVQSAESFFKTMKEKDYTGIWRLLTVKSRTTIVNDVVKRAANAYSTAQIETDFSIGGLIARSYWDEYLFYFDPTTVLEQSKWEMGSIARQQAEIILQYKKAKQPARLKMFKEESQWKVGLIETFGTEGRDKPRR